MHIRIGSGGRYTDSTPWGGSQSDINVRVQLWNGSWSTSFNQTLPLNWDPDAWNTAGIRKAGATYRIYLNGSYLTEFEDTFMNGSGRIGLHTYGTHRYDNFRVSRLP